ncbi:MunI family type II restriction endonuclease [bacterium]|nr:MunI family type II restriction endonuclease [bacterium]
MSKKELKKRANWQTESLIEALAAEDIFHISIKKYLNQKYPNKFIVERHPSEFRDIYSKYNLSEKILEKIYNVNIKNEDGSLKYKWGISMDFAIRNLDNGKILFGEIKRQDGWIEWTNMQSGRGNAHERCCKYFTPGLLNTLREKSKLPNDILPFWIVFTGDITRDPRRNREIAFWFQEYTSNYFMWHNTYNDEELTNFFENNLLEYLL